MTKVISILGSPRKKGTSARIAKAFTNVAEKLGAEVEEFYLNGMDYKGCQGCEQCHTKRKSCVLKDDLRAVLDGIHAADIAVFSTPVYYGDTSGQFKQFFDRTWSLIDYDIKADPPAASRLSNGKTAIFILSQGDMDEKHQDIVERYTPFFDLYGYDLKVVRATGLFSGDPGADVSILQGEVIKIAKTLLNNQGAQR